MVYIEPGALDAWIENTDPSLSAQAEVVVWLAELESVGPPPIVDYSAGDLPIAEATEHAHIEFHVVSAPLGTGPWERAVLGRPSTARHRRSGGHVS